MPGNNEHTFILSRIDSIGDVVLTLPMAGVLKKNFPGCKIIFLGRTYTRDVILLSEHVDGFLNDDDIEKKSFSEQTDFFKKQNADYFFHVFPHAGIARAASRAKIKHRVGTRNRWYHWLFCNRLLKLSRKNSELHEAQLNLKLLEPLNIKTDFSIREISDFYGFTKIPEINFPQLTLLDNNKINVILHPKSKGSAKEWGLNNFEKLIHILPEEKFEIFISGTREDGELLGDFLALNKNITNLCGQLSLQEFIVFIARADALVAASTGPLHIAAALGKNAIGLFSPRRPIHPGRWQPIGKNAHHLVYDENCLRCKEKKDCDCITKIEPERVLNILNGT